MNSQWYAYKGEYIQEDLKEQRKGQTKESGLDQYLLKNYYKTGLKIQK